jgi:hypothetical protein
MTDVTPAVLPYVATPVGDLVAATSLAARAAASWGLDSPVLLRVGMNAIFRCGDDAVIRVGRPTAPAEQSIWLADYLRDHGVLVPRQLGVEVIRAGDLSAVVVEFMRANGGPIDWAGVGAAVRRVHVLAAADVHGRYPLPSCSTFPWWQLSTLLAECVDDLDPTAAAGLNAALDRWHGWQHMLEHCEAVVCHGDIHPGNVVQTIDGPAMLDWDLLCTGPAAWDHAPLMTWDHRWLGNERIGERVYERFVAGYGESMRADWVGEALAELRLVAATLMRVRAGRHDPEVFAEAQRRLRHWRGDPDAPLWTAQ